MDPQTPVLRFRVSPAPLRDPILLVATRGGGSLAPGAVAELFEHYEPTLLAEIDPEPFYDFSAVRPAVRLVDGERVVRWPELRFKKVALDDHDLVVFSITEPSLGWRQLGKFVSEVATAFAIPEVILLNSFAGGTPHTRPMPLRWLANSADAPVRFGHQPIHPTYEGTAWFSLALGIMLRDAGFTVGTLSVVAPFYLGIEPSPYAVRALAEALAAEFGIAFDLEEIERHIVEVERQAAEQLSSSQHLRMFLANLEQQYDDAHSGIGVDDSGVTPTDDASSPPGRDRQPLDADRVLADVEALLRSGEDDGDPNDPNDASDRDDGSRPA